ncbi:MAG: OmpA family protein [Candidatus Binatia bacterium]
MKPSRLLMVLMVLWLALFSLPDRALADEYDDSQSHPLRIIAYVLHPFGVLAEWVVARPLHSLVSANKDLEYVFGHKPHPPMFDEHGTSADYGVTRQTLMGPMATAREAGSQESTAEKIVIKEVPVEKIVIKEVPKIVHVEKTIEVEKFVLPEVAFRFDSTDLTDLGIGRIYLAAQKLKEKSNIVVVLEGHADFIGSEEYNRRLGLRRAETVMQQLVEMGIDPERMSVASLGESKPMIGQKTDWARAINRRVEIRVKAP